MKIAQQQVTTFSTSAFGEAANTSPMEMQALRDHVTVCRGQRGRMFALHCATDAMSGFATTRLITTVLGLSALMGLAFMVV